MIKLWFKKDGFQEFQNVSLQMDKDLGNAAFIEEKEIVPQLLASTIVQRSLLVKILRRLAYFLDEELDHHDNALEYEEKFLEIIQVLKDKNISQNEFFEEDQLVRDLLKSIFKKILRNINSMKPEDFDVDVIFNKKRVDLD